MKISENIDIDISKESPQQKEQENIDIDIDIAQEILENIDIDRISYR